MATDRGEPAMADRSWRGYHPRALLPAVVLAAAASAVVLVGRWAFEDLSALANRVGALAVFGLAAAFWPGLIGWFVYRTVTYTYRLTDRAVLIDRGFRHRPHPPVWLTDVIAVESGGGWLARRLGVGWVRLVTSVGAVRLTGVRRPAEFAEQVRAAVRAARPG